MSTTIPHFEISDIALEAESLSALGTPTPIKAGSYASVWVAGSQGEFVIKSFHDADEQVARAEYDLLVRLNKSDCPYVPTAYCFGSFFDGKGAKHNAFVEECVDGMSLGELLASGALTGSVKAPTIDAPKAAAIALEVAKALESLARHGCAHRDLSPNNIMLANECIREGLRYGARVRIVDFGQSTGSSRRTVTQTAPRLATIPYGAPEIYGGEYYDRRNSESCDTWSLGALICCMMAGEHWPEEISDLRAGRIGLDDLPRIVDAKRVSIDLLSHLTNIGIQPSGTDMRLSGIVSACTNFNPGYRPPLEAVIEELEVLVGNDRQPVASQLEAVTPQVKRTGDANIATHPSVRVADIKTDDVATSPLNAPADEETQLKGTSVSLAGNSESEFREVLADSDGQEYEMGDAGPIDTVAPNLPENDPKTDIGADEEAKTRQTLGSRQPIRPRGDRVKPASGAKTEHGGHIRINGIQQIRYRQFYKNRNLLSATLSDSVIDIAESAFEGCESLREVHLPSRGCSIHSYAFRGCRELEYIYLPDNVRLVGVGIFMDCYSLAEISVPHDFPYTYRHIGTGAEIVRRSIKQNNASHDVGQASSMVEGLERNNESVAESPADVQRASFVRPDGRMSKSAGNMAARKRKSDDDKMRATPKPSKGGDTPSSKAATMEKVPSRDERKSNDEYIANELAAAWRHLGNENYRKARVYFESAARRGSASAKNGLGLVAYGEKDLSQAARYFREASDEGCGDASCNLAICYAQGDGVETNYDMAFHYIHLSIRQGFDGSEQLDNIREHALQVVRSCISDSASDEDMQEAIHLLGLLIKEESDDAEYLLGTLYEQGRGVKKNLAEAARFYKDASSRGNEEAAARLRSWKFLLHR